MRRLIGSGKRPGNVLQFEKDPSWKRKPTIKSKPTDSWVSRWPLLLLVAAPVVGVGATWAWHTWPSAAFDSAPKTEQYNLQFSECHGVSGGTCVVDGDTIWLEGTKIRIADINTPEVGEPQCPAEAALGAAATSRFVALLNEGGFSLETVDRDEDQYGRKLRILTRDGDSLGDVLVREGLAERWQGYRRNWC